MDYIDRIKKLKNEKKITNDRLSELTGIPLGTLSKLLAGISDSPKLANIIAIIIPINNNPVTPPINANNAFIKTHTPLIILSV